MLKNTFSIYVGIDVRSLVERAIVKNVIDHKITPYVKQRSAVHAILEKTTLGKLNCKIYEKKWTVTSFKIKTCILGEIFQVELVEVEEKAEGRESRFSDGNVWITKKTTS